MGGGHVEALIEENGVTCGVLYRDQENALQAVHSTLTVDADGRGSSIRSLCGAESKSTSVPMDVLWFRLQLRIDDLHDKHRFHVGGGI